MPRGLRRGICRECGREADSAQGTWCAEHRPLGTDRAPRARVKPSDAVADQLAAELETQLGMAAMLWTMRDPVCGAALQQAAPGMAAYWANRARENARFARALENMVGSGGLLAGIAVHAPLIMAVLSHHVLPALERRRTMPEPEQGVEYPAPFPMPAGAPPAPGVIVDRAAEPFAAGGTAPDPAGEAAAQDLEYAVWSEHVTPFPMATEDGTVYALGADEEAVAAALAGEAFGIAAGGPYATDPDGIGTD